MAFNKTVQAALDAAKAREAAFGPAKKDAAQLPALTLAYIGDTVYDLFVRTALIQKTDVKVHALHMLAAKQVCAAGQTKAFRKIEPHLTEEELAVFKRGRNAHSGTVPKNAQLSDYRTATGLEALVGWLYWTGAEDRLGELMDIALKEGEE